LEELLGTFGIECDKAFDGQTVLDLIDKDLHKDCFTDCGTYKVILLDNSMPNKSGIEVACEIR
jgi:DNA-binding response OmpR family regulator